MTALAILFLTGMLQTGCTTTRTLPAWQGDKIFEEVKDSVAVRPHEECNWPDIHTVTLGGNAGGFLNTEELNMLRDCRAIAEATHELTNTNADAVDALLGALNKMNAIGKAVTELAVFELNELDRDRQSAELEAWSYKGLLAAVLVAIAL